MKTTIIVDSLSDDNERKNKDMDENLLNTTSSSNMQLKIVKSSPSNIIQSTETDRRRHLQRSSRISDFHIIKQSSVDTTDEDLDDNYETTTTTTNSSEKRPSTIICTHRSPSDTRIQLFSDNSAQYFTNTYTRVLDNNEINSSNLSFTDRKSFKRTRIDYLRRDLTRNRISRQFNSLFSSLTPIRLFSRCCSTQNSLNRPVRRRTRTLSPNSKWHFVRHHLHDIAMMNESYARKKLTEHDSRWNHLSREVFRQILEMREILILRQQEDGTIKKPMKTNVNLKNIPVNEVVHVEQEGQIYSINTRDLVLGHFLGKEELQLDAFAQLEARRKFQVKQNLLKQQEGRTRLKRQIAFSICLCNLFFIIFMFITMFIFAMTTIIELRIRESF